MKIFGKKNNPSTDQTAPQLASAQAKAVAQGTVSVRDIIAPPSIEVDFDSIKIGETYFKTLFVIGYPRYVGANWLSPLINFNHTLEISMFHYPVEAQAVLDDIKRKIGEMEATISTDIQRGKVVDPSVEVALDDAREFQQNLVKGAEKFFQFGLYVTELANDAPKLAANTPDEESHGETSPMSVGKLRLNIERWAYGVNQIADTPDKPIESNLNKVFLHAYRHVVRQRKEDRQRAFMRQQEEERQRVRDEIERKRKEAERIRAEEEARRASLVSQSGNWEQANCIRALVTHIAAAGGQSSNNQTFSDWKSWALQVADDLDPTSALLESFQNFEKNADAQDASAIVMNL